MISIKIKSVLNIKKILGASEVTLDIPDGSTLEEVIFIMVNNWGEDLSSQLFNPADKKILPYIRIMINGRDIAFLNRLKTEIHAGDQILLLPPAGGG